MEKPFSVLAAGGYRVIFFLQLVDLVFESVEKPFSLLAAGGSRVFFLRLVDLFFLGRVHRQV